MDLPQLPTWLQALLPEPRPVSLLSYHEASGEFHLTSPDGTVTSDPDVTRVAQGDYRIDPTVYSHFNAEPSGHFFVPQSTGHMALLSENSDQHRVEMLQEEYRDFLEAAHAYQANPESFYEAYRFLNLHPAFWTCQDAEVHPYFWNTDCGVRTFSQYVTLDEEGEGPPTHRVMLEAGVHYGPAYRETYHDWRLDTEADTFEEAYVELARLVNTVYDWAGEDRPAEEIPEELR